MHFHPVVNMFEASKKRGFDGVIWTANNVGEKVTQDALLRSYHEMDISRLNIVLYKFTHLFSFLESAFDPRYWACTTRMYSGSVFRDPRCSLSTAKYFLSSDHSRYCNAAMIPM